MKQTEGMLSYQEVLAQIADSRIAPVYLFFGEEPFLAERALQKLVDAIVDPQLRDLTYSVFEADSTDQKTICSEARTVPLLASRRLVVVRRAHLLELRSKKAPIILYLQNPCETTCLVLMTARSGNRKKPGDRKKQQERDKRLASLVIHHGIAVTFPELKPPEVIKWVQYEASHHGKTISGQAAAELQQLSGTNLSEVHNELQKVITYVGSRERIELTDVIAAASDIHHETTYALADAVADQDVGRALQLVENLLRDGEEVLRILWRLDWHIDRLHGARIMIDQGLDSDTVAQQFGIKYYRERFFGQVRKVNRDRLPALLHELIEADFQLKSTNLDARLVLETLIVKMCGGNRAIVQIG